MLKVLLYRRNNRGKPDKFKDGKIDFFGLTLVLEGNITYYINNVKYELNSGDGIYLQKNCLRSRAPFEKAHYVSITFQTDKDIALPVKISAGVTQTALKIIDLFDTLKAEGAQYEDGRYSLLCEYLLAELSAGVARNQASPLVKDIKGFIAANRHRSIALKEVGEAMYFSPNYCQAVFKRETGQSIIEYSIRERISLARELITESDISLPEVAEKTGFSDYNYFARAFRRITGLTPSHIKRLKR